MARRVDGWRARVGLTVAALLACEVTGCAQQVVPKTLTYAEIARRERSEVHVPNAREVWPLGDVEDRVAECAERHEVLRFTFRALKVRWNSDGSVSVKREVYRLLLEGPADVVRECLAVALEAWRLPQRPAATEWTYAFLHVFAREALGRRRATVAQAMAEQRFDDAITAAHQVIAAHPGDEVAWRNLAVIACRTGKRPLFHRALVGTTGEQRRSIRVECGEEAWRGVADAGAP